MAKINDNTRPDSRFYSEPVHDAAHVISMGIVASNFRIIDFKVDDSYNQYCIDYEDGKFQISSFKQNVRHNLAQALPAEIITEERIAQWDLFFFLKDQEYLYDSYYDTLIEPSDLLDKINASIVDFPTAKDEVLFVKGEYTDCRPLLYCLQKRFQKVIVIPNYDVKPINFIDSFMVPLAMNAKIEINPQASPADYIEDWSPAIFVPLIDNTLDSKFYGNLTWRDILPDNPKKDFDLGEFPIKTLWVKFDYDAYGHIYVSCKFADNSAIRLDTSKCEPQCGLSIDKEPTLVVDESPVCTKSDVDNAEVEQTTGGTSSFKEPDQKYEEIYIKEGDTHTYSEIFSKYLYHAEVITLQDAHLRLEYQQLNLQDFLSVVNAVGCCRKFRLVTKLATYGTELGIGKVQLTEDEVNERNKNFLKALKTLRQQAKQLYNIDFSYKLEDKIHDRELKLSNGWKITLGRGLDIFQRRQGLELPKCRETKLTCIWSNPAGQKKQ